MAEYYFEIDTELDEQKRASSLYFMPAIIFVIFVISALAGHVLNSGLWSAWMGISLVTPMLYTTLVAIGLLTSHFYTLEVRAESVASDFVIGFAVLFTVNISAYLIGFETGWMPSLADMLTFFVGFIAYQAMRLTFDYAYNIDGLEIRSKVVVGAVGVMLIGAITIYLLMNMGLIA